MSSRINDYQQPFEIAGQQVMPGTRVSFSLPIGNLYNHAPLDLPIEVIHGRIRGPVLLVCAAIHGDELNGVEIIRRLSSLKILNNLTGTLVLVPIVNLFGFIHRSRYLPDRRDLNRCFPGSERGSIGARVANLFFIDLVRRCSHIIDLHTGAVHRENLPQIRATLAEPGVKKMAMDFSIPVILDSAPIDNSLRKEVSKLHIPILTFEAGEALRLNEHCIVTGVRGTVNVMRGLKMLSPNMNSGWQDTLLAAIKYIKEIDRNNPSTNHKIDLAIVCALYDPELKAILDLPWNWSPAEPLDSSDFFHRGTVMANGQVRSVVAVHQPRMGMVASAITTSKIIEKFRPRVVTMTGICAGIESSVSLGDVIFADPAWDYQSGKHKSSSTGTIFEIAPDQIPADTSAAGAMRQLAQDSSLLFELAGQHPQCDNFAPKLHVGPMASGSAVIADEDIVAKILPQNRKLKGLEMEIYGVYSAVTMARIPRPNVYAIKTVCDLANSEKNDDLQRYASYMSAKIIKDHPGKAGGI